MLLKRGSTGGDVKQLQEKLGVSPADGSFGPATEAAVMAWQAGQGLAADGKVGPLTWGALFEVGNFADLEADDLHEDDEPGDGPETDGGEFADIDGLGLSALKGLVPPAVIVQIPLTAATFAINTPLRLAHFLAQVGHESGGFKFTAENLNYSAKGLKKTFGRYFPGNVADGYAGKPEKIASRVYAGRMGNGDEASKDGWKYRGRGYIQLTGKSNYREFDAVVAEDILANPDLVAAKYPLLSAAWFWNDRDLHHRADQGTSEATLRAVTRRVNGGEHGLADRLKRFQDYSSLLGV